MCSFFVLIILFELKYKWFFKKRTSLLRTISLTKKFWKATQTLIRGTISPAGKSKYGKDGNRSSGIISAGGGGGGIGNPGGGREKSGNSIPAERKEMLF